MWPRNAFRALIRRIFHPIRRTIRKADGRRLNARLILEQFEGKITPSSWAPLTMPPALAAVGAGDMLLLTDGEVMAQAGVSNAWFRLTANGFGNYDGTSWIAAAPESLGRQRFAANVLPDGQVVVIGGEHIAGSGNLFDFTNSAEM